MITDVRALPENNLIAKDYMGDGVYIEDAGFTVILTTENGICAQNTVHIEPLVWECIQRYMKRVEERRNAC